MKRKNELTGLLKSVGSIVVLIAVVVGLNLYYINQLKQVFYDEATVYLSEISDQISQTIHLKVDSTLKNLQATAFALEYYEQDENKDAMSFLKQEAEKQGYLSLSFINLDGTGHTSDGRTISVSQHDYFQRVISGETVLADLTVSPLDDKEAFIYAVPIYRNGEVSGVLSALVNLEESQKYIGYQSFGGEGFCHVVCRDGTVILSSQASGLLKNTGNLYQVLDHGSFADGTDEEKLYSAIQNGKSGLFAFSLNGEVEYVSYQPLAINDWYLFSVVPEEVVTGKTELFLWGTDLICGVVIALFILLLIVLLSQQHKSKKELEQIAFVDPVTKGINGIRFEQLGRAKIRSASAGTYAMAALDIEQFKLVNDHFGRNRGDGILRDILQTIQNDLDDDELVSRVSADNFMVLLRFSSKEEVFARLERFQEQVNLFNEDATQKYYITFSKGVYVIDDPTLDFVTIQDRADVARKEAAKVEGSEHSGLYAEEKRIRLLREKELENRMHAALTHGEFIVYLQPKYELKNNTIAGAEALVRWKDSQSGLIPSGDFIPLFEKNGFVKEIDIFVFEEVCKTLSRWLKEGRNVVPISVNLSRVHLSDPHFLDQFEKIFSQYQIPAHLIEVELTETLFFENRDVLIESIRHIHQIGFACSLDDFGSGYSSLNMLKDLPVDILKLDRAFFDLKGDETSRGNTVVENVVAMAQKLGMQTVAEGVELPNQVNFLRSVYCDMVQGYVFAKPMPIADFEKKCWPNEKGEGSVL